MSIENALLRLYESGTYRDHLEGDAIVAFENAMAHLTETTTQRSARSTNTKRAVCHSPCRDSPALGVWNLSFNIDPSDYPEIVDIFGLIVAPPLAVNTQFTVLVEAVDEQGNVFGQIASQGGLTDLPNAEFNGIEISPASTMTGTFVDNKLTITGFGLDSLVGGSLLNSVYSPPIGDPGQPKTGFPVGDNPDYPSSDLIIELYYDKCCKQFKGWSNFTPDHANTRSGVWGRRQPKSKTNNYCNIKRGRTFEISGEQPNLGVFNVQSSLTFPFPDPLVTIENGNQIVFNGEFPDFFPAKSLVTNQTFYNFEMEVDFYVEQDWDAGIVLRSQYQIQILGNDQNLDSTSTTGAIFSMKNPTSNEVIIGTDPTNDDDWNHMVIKLVDRNVTVTLNGVVVQNDVTIPRPLRASLLPFEGLAGGLLLYRGAGVPRFRNIFVTELLKDKCGDDAFGIICGKQRCQKKKRCHCKQRC